MGKDAMDGRLLALLAVIAIVAGAFLACWQVQYADAANPSRTLPVATIAPSAYRTGSGSTSGNNLLNSSQLQLQVSSHLLPALSSSTAYLLNKDFDTVSVIDVGKQKVIKHIKVGSYPVDMAWNAAKNRLYVVNMGSDSLTVIDTTTDAKTGEIDLLFPGPEHIVVSPDGKKIYVSAYNDNGYLSSNPDLLRPTGGKSVLLTVDAETGRLSRVVSLPFTAGQMAISPDGNRLYLLSGADYGVLDTNTWKVLKSPRPYVPPQSAGFAHDMGADSTCLALSPDGKWLYVTNTTRYNEIPQGYAGMPLRYHLVDLDQVDTATYQVKKTVQLTYNDTEKPHDSSWGGLGGLGGNNYVPITADGIAVSPDGWLVVVTSYLGNTYNYGTMNAFYNENSGFRWAGTYAIDTTSPEGVAFSPDGRTICLANGPDNACSLIETGMGKITTITANPSNMIANDGATRVVTRPGPVGSSSGGPLTINDQFIHTATLPKKGQMPASMQASPSTENGALYVSNNLDNSVSVIDLATGQVNGTIDVYKSPTSVAITPDGSRVFVIDHVLPASSVSVIDANTGAVVKTAENPKVEYTDVLASPDGTSIYLSTKQWASDIAVLDAATGNLKRSIVLPQDSHKPNHMALSPKGRFMYLTYDDRTLVFDVIDDKVRGKIDYVGDGAAVCSPDGDLYVASKGLGIVAPVDPVARQPLYERAIHVSSPGDMAISPDGKRLYVLDTVDNALIVANTATGTIVDVVDLASPNFPASLHSNNNSVVVSPNGTRVYVSNPAYGTVWVIDAASNYIIKSIKVGNGPEGMAVRYADDRTYKGSPESSYLNTALSAQTVSGYTIPALKDLQVEDTPITLQSGQVRTRDGSNISRLAANGFMLVPASAGGMAYYNVTTGSATGDAATVKGIRLEIGKQAPIEAGGVRVMAEATMNAVPVDSSVDLLVLPPESVDLGRISEALNLSGTRLDGGALAAVEIDRSSLENGRDIGSATLTFQFPKPAGFDPAKRYCVVRQDGSATEVLETRYLGEGANETVSFEAVSPRGFSTFTLVMTAAPAASATPRATASGGSADGLWGILVVMAALGLGFVARLGRKKSGK